MANPTHRVFVVSGPSGVGKSTLIREVMRQDPELRLSISSTTRSPREGEQDGRDYYFVERAEFERMIEAGAFLEWAQVYDNYYGSSRSHVERILAAGQHAMMDVDTQGAMNIKKLCSGAVFIFIMPPSIKALEERLRDRRSETEESFQRRMAWAQHEISFKDQYDYVIANDSVEHAVSEFRRVLESEKRKNVPFGCKG
jgi:guanylate kinase